MTLTLLVPPLGIKHPPAPITDVKGRTRLPVSEPANSVFWAWEPVEGAGPVSIKYGATSLTTSQVGRGREGEGRRGVRMFTRMFTRLSMFMSFQSSLVAKLNIRTARSRVLVETLGS